MYRQLALLALFAVLISAAFAQKDFSANIKLRVFEDSSKHWLAVDPVGDNDATVKIEMLETSSNSWVEMKHTPESSYWQAWSTSASGFDLPMSFRLTSVDGEQVIMDNVMNVIASGKELETAVKFTRSARSNGHNGGRNGDSEDAGAGSYCPTRGPTTAPSNPTTAPADPTTAPTQPATHPTQPATHAPTQPATHAPTQPATHAPTQPATHAPTSAPTQRPTQRPTSAPTSAPTTKPSSSGSSGSSSTDLCAITPTSQEPVKILVPLYQEPGKDWDSLITSANAGTSIIAIINPDNGPVSSGPPSNWVTYMNKMNAANIDMIGYVATGYAGNSISSLKSQIDTYASKYTGLKGIFLDEVSNEKADIPFYQELYDYIMAKSGYVHDVLNPGASTDEGYMAASTSIVIYEDQASGYKNPTASWVKCAPTAAEKAGYKYRFSGIAFSASQSEMTTLVSQMASAGIGMVYITDKSLPNPYDPIPSYWTTFANTVKGL